MIIERHLIILKKNHFCSVCGYKVVENHHHLPILIFMYWERENKILKFCLGKKKKKRGIYHYGYRWLKIHHLSLSSSFFSIFNTQCLFIHSFFIIIAAICIRINPKYGSRENEILHLHQINDAPFLRSSYKIWQIWKFFVSFCFPIHSFFW